MKRRILVTGGAGFIGSHLVDLFLAEGEAVTVLDDFSVGLSENLAAAERSGDLSIVRGSICDPQAVAAAMAACDRVYHLAVQCVRRSLGRPIESHDVNATGTLILLEEARRIGVTRFVYCSSSEVYGNASDGLLDEDTTLCAPTTVYGAAKLAGELYAEAYRRTYGLDTIVVRPFNAYGPRAYLRGTRAEVLPRFLGAALNHRSPIIFGDGSNGRDFTYVTEVAAGIRMAGESDAMSGQRINIAFGRMVTTAELAGLVLSAVGRNAHTVEHRDARPGDVHQLHADTRKAERLLGFRARIDIEAGIALYIAWSRDAYPDVAGMIDLSPVNWSMPQADDVRMAPIGAFEP